MKHESSVCLETLIGLNFLSYKKRNGTIISALLCEKTASIMKKAQRNIFLSDNAHIAARIKTCATDCRAMFDHAYHVQPRKKIKTTELITLG